MRGLVAQPEPCMPMQTTMIHRASFRYMLPGPCIHDSPAHRRQSTSTRVFTANTGYLQACGKLDLIPKQLAHRRVKRRPRQPRRLVSSKKKTAREKTMAWRVAVASVIKRAREEKRRNQADFAKELGWSVDKLALMESGEGKVEFG